MYCGKCGSKLENDATFCPYCGNKIDENKDTLPKKEIKENILHTKEPSVKLLIT